MKVVHGFREVKSIEALHYTSYSDCFDRISFICAVYALDEHNDKAVVNAQKIKKQKEALL